MLGSRRPPADDDELLLGGLSQEAPFAQHGYARAQHRTELSALARDHFRAQAVLVQHLTCPLHAADRGMHHQQRSVGT